MLKVSGLKVAYGGIQAVKGVSFEVREGELVSLIGANGAGKTTTLKAITGTQPVADGDIEFMGQPIKGQGAWDLVRQGLVMVPEGRGTFTRMTITENLQMGAFVRERQGDRRRHRQGLRHLPAPEGARQAARRHDERRRAADAGDGARADGAAQGAAARRAVDGPVARSWSTRSSRSWPTSTAAARRCCWSSRTPARALQLADRGYVMESGEITMSGEAKALLNDPKVRAAYLGE